MDDKVKAIIAAYPYGLAVVTTIALWISGRSTYRKERAANLLEASTTWREVAESRKIRIEELTREVEELERKVSSFKAVS